jgi:hypothetical protein
VEQGKNNGYTDDADTGGCGHITGDHFIKILVDYGRFKAVLPGAAFFFPHYVRNDNRTLLIATFGKTITVCSRPY